jgi:hypothetical protein
VRVRVWVVKGVHVCVEGMCVSVVGEGGCRGRGHGRASGVHVQVLNARVWVLKSHARV